MQMVTYTTALATATAPQNLSTMPPLEQQR